MHAKIFTHLQGNQSVPKMVDISKKIISNRVAVAACTMTLPSVLMDKLNGKMDVDSPKGPIFATAIVAGTLAVKQTSHFIPFCHPLPIDGCEITVKAMEGLKIRIECSVKCQHKTGVEMEAMTGASMTALCIYDMCKSVSKKILIHDIQLIRKTGGKSDAT